MRMKMYIASRWSSQCRLRDIADRLRQEGIEVTSKWIWMSRPEDQELQEFFEKSGASRAAEDEHDIAKSDYLVLDTTDGIGRHGGMMYEAGLARGLGKRIAVVGKPVGVFDRLFMRFENWDQFIDAVRYGPVIWRV